MKTLISHYIFFHLDEDSDNNEVEEPPKSDHTIKNQREIIESSIRIRLDLFKSDKRMLEETFIEAILNYPESVVLKKYKEDFESMFRCERFHKAKEDQESIQDIMQIGKETQEFLTGDFLTNPQEEDKEYFSMNSSDAEFWSNPKTHGDLDLLFERLETMKGIGSAEIAKRMRKYTQNLQGEKFIQRLNEVKEDEDKEDVSVKVQFHKSIEKRNATEKQKIDKSCCKSLRNMEVVNDDRAKNVMRYMEESPSFSLGMEFSVHEEVEEEAVEQKKKEKKTIPEDIQNIIKEKPQDGIENNQEDECLNISTAKVSGSLKSSNEDAVIDIKKYCTSEEKKLTAWLFVLTGESK